MENTSNALIAQYPLFEMYFQSLLSQNKTFWLRHIKTIITPDEVPIDQLPESKSKILYGNQTSAYILTHQQRRSGDGRGVNEPDMLLVLSDLQSFSSTTSERTVSNRWRCFIEIKTDESSHLVTEQCLRYLYDIVQINRKARQSISKKQIDRWINGVVIALNMDSRIIRELRSFGIVVYLMIGDDRVTERLKDSSFPVSKLIPAPKKASWYSPTHFKDLSDQSDNSVFAILHMILFRRDIDLLNKIINVETVQLSQLERFFILICVIKYGERPLSEAVKEIPKRDLDDAYVESIRDLDIQAIHNLSDDQIKHLSDDQIKHLSDDQIKHLSDDQVKHLSDDQIKHLSDDQLLALSEGRIEQILRKKRENKKKT